ncbi:MAG: NAD-dependent epimerase/dehydratase family protein [Bacteroidetes bacterium]|nr:MAG: NAD-dependent epimerase/dehydratase family protein [Bacteroidota bacterium]
MKKIMVTGGTGYIGAWVVKYLLDEGHTVRVTVRDKSKTEKTAPLEAVAADTKGTLEFWEADLLKPGSFMEAMDGCEVVYHLASPFLFGNIKDPYAQLINPALEGTKNVLDAVNKTDSVKRVALTSSVVSVYGDNIDIRQTENNTFTEDHWNTTSTAKHNPYNYSKVLAEKEAWKIHDAQDRWSLVVLNPGFVMGPSLTNASGSASLTFIQDLLSGKQKMGVPELYFSFVDVRNVARAHILAADNPKAEGRHILVSDCMSMLEFSNLVGEAVNGKFQLPKNELPKFMLYLVGWTQGISWKYINNNVGIPVNLDNTKSKQALGLEYIPIKDTAREHANQLIEGGIVG